jgi:NAD(P)-dependent dehydrogenase (short-subunit alcohol dehydrogenase family)
MPFGPDAVDLTDKVALVTGAAQGIGAATALTLARFGADLAACDREPSGLRATAAAIEATGRRCVLGDLDVRDEGAVTAWLGEVAAAYGHVDVLVNNAGGGFYAPVADVSAKGQQALVDENFTSVTNFIRGSLELFAPGAAIINVTSIEASRAAPGFGVYAAMKAAVESLTKTLALELAPRGVRVNAIAPDAMPTPGDEDLAEAVTQGQRTAYGRKVPLGWGDVDDAAGAVVYLASDLARWVTGTVLRVDGGSHAASGWARRDDGTYEP